MVTHGSHESAAERLSLVIHELRAPLTVVRGYLQLLGQPRSESDREKARLAADRAVERLELLLDDLVAAISNPAVFAPAVQSHVALRELAEEVAEEVLPLRPARISVRGGAGEVHGDRTRLRQAVENLVSNAVKHTPEDGAILIEVYDADESQHVRLAVQDSGPGISPEDRERVFDLFERLEAGSDAPPGLGLGLPIARAIVVGHGGHVYLTDSAKENGARFVMELPAPATD